MSRRIEIELTSARPDGSWTWRAAGAREPKGVLDGSLLPAGAKAGGVFRADAAMELEGITILSVTDPKAKAEKSGLLELIPSTVPFEAVTQQLAKRDRNDRPRNDRGDRGDRPRRDRPAGDRPGGPRPGGAPGGDRPRSDRPGGPRPGGAPGGDRPRGDRPSGDRPSGDRPRGDRPTGEGSERRGPRPERRGRPNFTPPPELPQRPKPKRLKPGRAHRNTVLADLPEAQRPVAERALQGGIPAVRQAVIEQNARLKAAGQDEIPAAGLVAMAEQLLPKLRVAEWLDRADAALVDIDELDLRDLRSVVAASDDPMVARDETTREVAAKLKLALVAKQEKELLLWFEDIDAAIAVGRIIRALKLSSQPPKAGVRFPAELAKRLADAATASLTTDSPSDRWAAVLEATAFAPVRAQVLPAARPENPSDELVATVKRLASLLPQIATLFGVDVVQGGPSPKPLRPTKPTTAAKKAVPPPPKPKAEAPVAATPVAPVVEAPVAETAVVEAPVAETPEAPVTETPETPVVEAPVAETPVAETPVVETPVVETPVAETPVAEAPVAETPVVETPVVEAPVVETPVVEAPVVETPVAEAPVVETPVAEVPVAETPVAETPVAEVPVAETSVAETPVIEAPVAETHVAEAPVAETPVADQPGA
jgi:hypothetical protein